MLVVRAHQLRKKLERIDAAEAKASEGKELTKEQGELLSTRPAVQGALDEILHSFPKLEDASRRDRNSHLCFQEATASTIEQSQQTSSTEGETESPQNSLPSLERERVMEQVEHGLLPLIYLAMLFDGNVTTEWTRLTHLERDACKSHLDGAITDRELDLLVEAGRLLTQRRTDSFVSHEEALQTCAYHGRKLIDRSSEYLPLRENGVPQQVTYADIRSYADAVCSSSFFTIQPVQVTENSLDAPTGMLPPGTAGAGDLAAGGTAGNLAPPQNTTANGMDPQQPQQAQAQAASAAAPAAPAPPTSAALAAPTSAPEGGSMGTTLYGQGLLLSAMQTGAMAVPQQMGMQPMQFGYGQQPPLQQQQVHAQHAGEQNGVGSSSAGRDSSGGASSNEGNAGRGRGGRHGANKRRERGREGRGWSSSRQVHRNSEKQQQRANGAIGGEQQQRREQRSDRDQQQQ